MTDFLGLDIADLDRRALARVADLVDRVTVDRLGLPTPCAGWDLGELVRHLVSENEGFAVNARTGVPDRTVWDGGRLGADPGAAFRASAAGVSAAFAEFGVPERRMEVREFGVFGVPVAMSLHFVDYLVHGWDVARALGEPAELDPDLVEAALLISARWPAPRPAGGPFAERVAVPGNAPAADRLVAYLGRDPRWSPSL